jgi:hypothetical protein
MTCRIGFRTRASHLRVWFRRHEQFRPQQGVVRTVAVTVPPPSPPLAIHGSCQRHKGTCQSNLAIRRRDRPQMNATGAESRPPAAGGHMYRSQSYRESVCGRERAVSYQRRTIADRRCARFRCPISVRCASRDSSAAPRKHIREDKGR